MLQDAHEKATLSAELDPERLVRPGWAPDLRILLILVVALVLRAVIRASPSPEFIERMNRTVQAVAGTALGGLLVNAERRRQRSHAIGSVLRSVASFLVLGTAALMMTVETSRGAEQTISTTKYEVTGRGGKGRELLQRGQFTRIVPTMPDTPPPLEE